MTDTLVFITRYDSCIFHLVVFKEHYLPGANLHIFSNWRHEIDKKTKNYIKKYVKEARGGRLLAGVTQYIS